VSKKNHTSVVVETVVITTDLLDDAISAARYAYSDSFGREADHWQGVLDRLTNVREGRQAADRALELPTTSCTCSAGDRALAHFLSCAKWQHVLQRKI
jgi:hypothetical protein